MRFSPPAWTGPLSRLSTALSPSRQLDRQLGSQLSAVPACPSASWLQQDPVKRRQAAGFKALAVPLVQGGWPRGTRGCPWQCGSGRVARGPSAAVCSALISPSLQWLSRCGLHWPVLQGSFQLCRAGLPAGSLGSVLWQPPGTSLETGRKGT